MAAATLRPGESLSIARGRGDYRRFGAIDGQNMLNYLKQFFQRQFADPQKVILVLVLGSLTVAFLLLGKIFAPILASLILAYLLEGPVRFLHQLRCPRSLAVVLVFSGFLCGSILLLVALVPLLYRQALQLLSELPRMLEQAQAFLLTLPERYPAIASEELVKNLISSLRIETLEWSDTAIAISLGVLSNVPGLVVYLVLVPFTVFFLLKDKTRLLEWIQQFMPSERRLAEKVWAQSNHEIAQYIRGKFWEILIVGAASVVVFLMLGLNYATLLGVATGLSVLIPYIGAAVLTLPVGLIAYFQWGWGIELFYTLLAYLVIQVLDGNVLFPLLFSRVVDLHPVAIIAALLFFGSIWGFWGIFFSIPLATVVKAVLNAWMTATEAEPPAATIETA